MVKRLLVFVEYEFSCSWEAFTNRAHPSSCWPNKLLLSYISHAFDVTPHFCFLVDFMMRALWMWGMTPPPAIVALIKVSSSSSPLIASCKCLGVILLTFKSFDALPASSRTSAVKYSRIAALYTAEVAPTLLLALTQCMQQMLMVMVIWMCSQHLNMMIP